MTDVTIAEGLSSLNMLYRLWGEIGLDLERELIGSL